MKFRMVDRIFSYEPRRSIRGSKAISFEEYSLRDPLGSPAALPESLLLESLFQLGNWLIMLSSDFTEMGLVIRTGQIEFLQSVGPGERLDGVITVKNYRDDGICFDGEAYVGNQLVARGSSCLAVPVALSEYQNPEHLKVLFSEIHRPGES
jgi:3-hydroxymyristoyl/3-hydroxydecanoyl-(acyl carrier protein) dehydratase